MKTYPTKLIDRAKKRFKTDLNKWLYTKAAGQILTTPPLIKGNLPFITLSMVHQRDVLSYLVAVKSFAEHANPERIVIVCDPSIGNHERSIFKKQIPHVELRNAQEFFNPGIPQGGTWERLHAITTYSPSSYIVQLDADTLTTQAIPEVVDAISQQYGFVIAEEPNQQLVSLEETAIRAKPWIEPSVHIQGLSEAIMNELPLSKRRYVRGCSGFTSFPQSTTLKQELLDFSEQMWGKIGNRWTEWGTEQITSNYLVANMEGTTVLPFPKYCTPNKEETETAFLHFIGSMRFTNRKYEKKSAETINHLRK